MGKVYNKEYLEWKKATFLQKINSVLADFSAATFYALSNLLMYFNHLSKLFNWFSYIMHAL